MVGVPPAVLPHPEAHADGRVLGSRRLEQGPQRRPLAVGQPAELDRAGPRAANVVDQAGARPRVEGGRQQVVEALGKKFVVWCF